jgi:hypothetical protein
MTHYLLQL